MVEPEEGVDKQRVMEEFERATFEAPVIHPAPVRIPAGALPAAREPEWALRVGPTIVVAAVAVAWTAAAYARHDLEAYLFGFAFACAAIVSVWARSTRRA